MQTCCTMFDSTSTCRHHWLMLYMCIFTYKSPYYKNKHKSFKVWFGKHTLNSIILVFNILCHVIEPFIKRQNKYNNWDGTKILKIQGSTIKKNIHELEKIHYCIFSVFFSRKRQKSNQIESYLDLRRTETVSERRPSVHCLLCLKTSTFHCLFSILSQCNQPMSLLQHIETLNMLSHFQIDNNLW